jgi:hypothetical protein
MYPPAIALPDELRETYLPLLLHQLHHLKQLAMLSLRPRNDVGSTAEEIVTVLDASHERVQLLATIARGSSGCRPI